MKYSLDLRSRAERTEPIEAKHQRFMSGLVELLPPWGLRGKEIPPSPDPGSDLVASVNLTKRLGPGIRGRVMYQFRREFRDEGADDDYLDIEFDPKTIDYGFFVYDVLPIYIEAFRAYLAEVYDEEFIYRDHQERKKMSFNSRRQVYRVAPVAFYDSFLCKRAFSQSPEKIAKKLEGIVERVDLVSGGIYIVGSSKVLTLEDADELSWKVKEVITG